MKATPRSWWQKIKKPLGIIGIIAACICVVVLIFLVVRLYGTGFVGKTLWDWLGLLAALAIPVVVGFGVAWFTVQQGKVSNAENKDNQREAVLQTYIDKMSELLLHENLRESDQEKEVRRIARERTVKVLSQLDGERKGTLLQFLHESALINGHEPIISLDKADLRKADLRNASLSEANLDGASLQEANLKGAFLSKVNLSTANLRDADLRNAFLGEATLIGADLSQANLREVNLSNAVLNWTRSLPGIGLEGLTEFELTRMNPNASEAELRQALQLGVDHGYLIPRESHMSETALRLALLGEANLTEVDLSGANLKNAVITSQQLEKAKSLSDAILPDGSKHL